MRITSGLGDKRKRGGETETETTEERQKVVCCSYRVVAEKQVRGEGKVLT